MGVHVVGVCFAAFAGAFVLVLSPGKAVGAANEIIGTDPCNSSKALVSLLLAERTRQQTETDVRLAALEAAQERNKIQTGPVVAFSARLGANLESFGFQQTLVFDDVMTNIGEAYNGDTGIFTCPETGIYFFGVTIVSEPFGTDLEAELIAGGKSRMLLFSSVENNFDSSSQSVLLPLQKDSRVFVRHHQNHGNRVHGSFSAFSGFLLRKGQFNATT